MNAEFLTALTPTTLAAIIADMSQHLADETDGDMSAQEWDAMHTDMLTVYNVLTVNVGGDVDGMLMKAGADPEVIYDFSPASA